MSRFLLRETVLPFFCLLLNCLFSSKKCRNILANKHIRMELASVIVSLKSLYFNDRILSSSMLLIPLAHNSPKYAIVFGLSKVSACLPLALIVIVMGVVKVAPVTRFISEQLSAIKLISNSLIALWVIPSFLLRSNNYLLCNP